MTAYKPRQCQHFNTKYSKLTTQPFEQNVTGMRQVNCEGKACSPAKTNCFTCTISEWQDFKRKKQMKKPLLIMNEKYKEILQEDKERQTNGRQT